MESGTICTYISPSGKLLICCAGIAKSKSVDRKHNNELTAPHNAIYRSAVCSGSRAKSIIDFGER